MPDLFLCLQGAGKNCFLLLILKLPSLFMEVCFATNNRHKLEEVRSLLGVSIKIVSLADIGCNEELAETNDTFEGNSLQKARYVFDRFKVPCFADDSGLEVAALGGAPGVYSARYAGPQRNDNNNIALLLRNLDGQPDRRANFRTVITLIGLGSEPSIFEGRIDGKISETMRGTNGFGYDPVFLPDGFDVTFAEMQMEQKNRISHRAIAVRKLATYLGSLNKDTFNR